VPLHFRCAVLLVLKRLCGVRGLRLPLDFVLQACQRILSALLEALQIKAA